MDDRLTEQIGRWLDTPPDQRNILEGAELLLKLSGNRVLYINILANPENRANTLEYELKRYHNFRLQRLTHSQVKEMESKVKTIVRNLPGKIVGKRPDHDILPEKVQALYVENASILRKIRLLHLKLSTLQLENASCPDSEKYPFVKEIINLDKQYHANWESYDKWTSLNGEEVLLAARKTESVKALRFVNLNKKRYRNNPTEAMKEKLAAQFTLIIAPPESLVKEMEELGISR